MDKIVINGIEYKFDGKIHKTNNADFKTLLGNRNIDPCIVEQLKQSMIKKGVLPIPVIVNENYEVIDGQHRIMAATELKEAIYYEIIPGLKLKDCIDLNAEQHKWSLVDYVSSYAKLGYEQYDSLLTMINTNPDLNANVVISAFGDRKGKTIKTGKYKIGDIRLGMELLNIARLVQGLMHKKVGGQFIDALKLMISEGAKPKLIEDSIQKNGIRYITSNIGSSENAYAVFTDMYNFTRSTNRVNFQKYRRIS